MNRILLLPVISILLFCAPAPAFADFSKGWDAYKNKNYATAMKEWKPLAEQGNASAQSNLGDMYRIGQGVIQDYKAALKWYRLAAEQGNARAQLVLGVMYDIGKGVIEDDIRAHMWYNVAASLGDKDAAKWRDEAAEIMTTSQIEKAQKLAGECIEKNYKDC